MCDSFAGKLEGVAKSTQESLLEAKKSFAENGTDFTGFLEKAARLESMDAVRALKETNEEAYAAFLSIISGMAEGVAGALDERDFGNGSQVIDALRNNMAREAVEYSLLLNVYEIAIEESLDIVKGRSHGYYTKDGTEWEKVQSSSWKDAMGSARKEAVREMIAGIPPLLEEGMLQIKEKYGLRQGLQSYLEMAATGDIKRLTEQGEDRKVYVAIENLLKRVDIGIRQIEKESGAATSMIIGELRARPSALKKESSMFLDLLEHVG